jgi:signal transduction histidine kinase
LRYPGRLNSRRIRAAIFEHALLLGFMAAVVPLIVLLALQFVWLRELDRASLASHRAALKGWLETVGTEVEYFYRSTGERLLNVPAALFVKGDVSRIAEYWSNRSREGARRLFAVDFSLQPTGNFYVYVPETAELVSSAASDESLAIVLATLPWHRWGRSNARESFMLQVNESDPEHRIVLRPVLGDNGMVVGVVGFVIDTAYFSEQLLPRIVDNTLGSLFEEETRRDLVITTRDQSTKTIYARGTEDSSEPPIEAHFPFIFADWTITAKSSGVTYQRFAGGRFDSNLALAFLSAAILLAGTTLAFLSARKAMRLSRMKSDFVSNVSHELRTPLASIRVFAEFLRSGKVKTPEKVVEYGEYIETESRRLSRLIDNILDFARIESSRKEYHLRPTDVVAMVQSVLHAFEVRLERAGMRLDLELPKSNVPSAELDEDAVSQALYNLLDNAIKYSSPGQEIKVVVARETDHFLISVRDRGIGIAKADQSRIFERFHRVSTGLVHDVKGSGLGLSIVDHIVKAHGGDVTLDSEPGRGSTFSLRLPIERTNHAETTDRRG